MYVIIELMLVVVTKSNLTSLIHSAKRLNGIVYVISIPDIAMSPSTVGHVT